MVVSQYEDKEFLKKYEERARIHRLVPFRKIVELCAELQGKTVLDVGCGTGDLTTLLSQQGAAVTGIDISIEWIDFCNDLLRKSPNPNVDFQVGDATKLDFPEESFDCVVLNMVLLNIDSFHDVERIVGEIARVLKPNGVLVFSDLHPIIIMGDRIRHRYVKRPATFSYFRDGDQYKAGVTLGDGSTIEFENRHWTLETYSRLLEKYGLCVSTISEPTYNKEAPSELRDYPVPEYLLLKCKKL